MDPKLFESNVYAVTGGAVGIGFAVVAQLINYGAYVYALDLGAEQSKELSGLPQERLGYIQCDVVDRKQCAAAVATIVAKHDRLDGLVNNAGICLLEGEAPPDDLFEKVYAVNVTGSWNMAFEAFPQMKKQGSGAVVNIGSTSSLVGVPRIPAYTSSKHAVAGLTKTWALDHAKYGIRVNLVGPGPTDTQMSRSPLQTVMGPRFGGNKTDDELLDLVAKTVPLQRIGKPDDIANPILFLLSDLSSFITGQCLMASGGS
ncbi:NAD(P)-binding protein [Mytilinidion resinicola]|uniref:NAD(P)-binding protein n=1 Tax=Mytilinidion resinicola TaxID=574789 RepID=A0A6A6Y106_9PEZI|nr:NAD(P)-binding protein [Mytilinidion resinicola]KAF2802340.1 NAD(P)-binding protein [Mytilinidion resinicola]